jgi:hypothetical protein
MEVSSMQKFFRGALPAVLLQASGFLPVKQMKGLGL